MKNIIILAALGIALSCCASCFGDRTPKNSSDTVTNTYKTTDSSKLDTGKMASPDHTAAGGSDLVKDTSKKKDTTKH